MTELARWERHALYFALEKKKARCASPSHSTFQTQTRGKRREPGCKEKKTVKRTSTTDQPLLLLYSFSSSSWVSVWFHRRAPYRSTSRVLCALLGAGVRRPTTGRRRRRGAARCFLPLDGSEPCWSHLCLRTPSLQKSPLLFLEELGLCPLLQFYRWVVVFTTWCLFSPFLCDGMRAYVWWKNAFRISQPHAWKKKTMCSVQNVCWVTFRIKYVWGKKMQITSINELTRW